MKMNEGIPLMKKGDYHIQQTAIETIFIDPLPFQCVQMVWVNPTVVIFSG